MGARGYQEQAILDAIGKARACTGLMPAMPFGDGSSVEKFAAALSAPGFWSTPFQKDFVDLPPRRPDAQRSAGCMEDAA